MYNYETEKPGLFTDEGQRKFLTVRDHAKSLLAKSGSFRMEQAINVVTGDSWQALACVDRLVELGEIREIPQNDAAGQHRIFVAR